MQIRAFGVTRLLVLAIVAASGCMREAAEVEVATQPIIGGTPASNGVYDAVGAIYINGQYWGSATLVHSQWMLTAAHIFDNAGILDVSTCEVESGSVHVALAADVRRGTPRLTVSEVRIMPRFCQVGGRRGLGGWHLADGALIRLAEPVTTVVPVPLSENPVTEAERMDPWEIVSHRPSNMENVPIAWSHKRRSARFFMIPASTDAGAPLTIDSAFFRIAVPNGTQFGFGDSGGPVFRTRRTGCPDLPEIEFVGTVTGGVGTTSGYIWHAASFARWVVTTISTSSSS